MSVCDQPNAKESRIYELNTQLNWYFFKEHVHDASARIALNLRFDGWTDLQTEKSNYLETASGIAR